MGLVGIWSHWGAQSVPMYGDWYARHMYVEGSDQYRYHIRHYGHPSKFGYKDLVQLWQAENFDPEGLMDLYVEAGDKQKDRRQEIYEIGVMDIKRSQEPDIKPHPSAEYPPEAGWNHR